MTMPEKRNIIFFYGKQKKIAMKQILYKTSLHKIFRRTRIKRRRKMTNVSFRRARVHAQQFFAYMYSLSFLGKSGFRLKISLPSSWRHQQCGHVVRSSSYVDRALGDPSNDEDPCGHESS